MGKNCSLIRQLSKVIVYANLQTNCHISVPVGQTHGYLMKQRYLTVICYKDEEILQR